MKKRLAILLALFLVISAGCGGSKRHGRDTKTKNARFSEAQAVEEISFNIYKKYNVLKNKKLAIYKFQNLQGKETSECRRISKILLESLMKRGNLRFIERSDLSTILKAQEVEISGIAESDDSGTTGHIIPVDVIISGTIVQQGVSGELSVKASDLRTGEIYFVSTVVFLPQGEFSYKEDGERLKLHRESPEKVEVMNRTFEILQFLSKKKPVLFIFLLSEKRDPDLADNTDLQKKLRHIAKKVRKGNRNQKNRIRKLRKGVKLIQRHDSVKYDALMKKKIELINKM